MRADCPEFQLRATKEWALKPLPASFRCSGTDSSLNSPPSSSRPRRLTKRPPPDHQVTVPSIYRGSPFIRPRPIYLFSSLSTIVIHSNPQQHNRQQQASIDQHPGPLTCIVASRADQTESHISTTSIACHSGPLATRQVPKSSQFTWLPRAFDVLIAQNNPSLAASSNVQLIGRSPLLYSAARAAVLYEGFTHQARTYTLSIFYTLHTLVTTSGHSFLERSKVESRWRGTTCADGWPASRLHLLFFEIPADTYPFHSWSIRPAARLRRLAFTLSITSTSFHISIKYQHHGLCEQAPYGGAPGGQMGLYREYC